MKHYLLILGVAMCFVNIKAQTGVDTKIAVNSKTDDKTFVVIVSNENYKNEESVPFAKNDGEVFKVYCQKTLGIPEDHIRFAPDATLGEMNFAIYWLGNMLKAYDGEARVKILMMTLMRKLLKNLRITILTIIRRRIRRDIDRVIVC